VANFTPEHTNICPGSTIQYRENTTNGTPTSWVWSFPGGTPSSYIGQIPPAIRYSSQGAYHAILIVSNAQGTDTIDKGNAAIVDWGFGIDNVPFSEGFEENQPVPNEWRVFNDDGGPAWQQTNRASYDGNYSMSVQNFESLDATKPHYTAPGSVKELQSPSINFTYVKASNDPILSFRLAYGQQYSGNTDSLSIGESFNCGAGNSWMELKKLVGSALATGSGGVQQGDFVPANQSQWTLVSIPLPTSGTSSVVGKSNVKFHFYLQTGLLSNNIYIDDININYTGALGVSEEPVTSFEFNAVPNPASQSFMVTYFLKQSEDLVINLYDLQGRLIRQLVNTHESPGSYENTIDGRSFNLASGMYVLKMITSDGVASKKLIYSKD
jgi:PKD repeat protein